MSSNRVSIEILDKYVIDEKYAENSEILFKEAIKNFSHKIIVLDDDPTGIQTVQGVSVYTNWDEETIKNGFLDENSMFFILTNSRSFSKQKTEEVHRLISRRVNDISKSLNKDFIIVSRGDSTLRGHYPLETNSLKAEMEKTNEFFNGEIFCPCFFEGGRYTFSDVHYVKADNVLVPVGNTEFSKDKSFSFNSSNLKEFIVEKNEGAVKKQDIISISIDSLRVCDVEKIYEDLTNGVEYKRIIVNALTYEDLKVFVAVLIKAIKAGKKYIIRSAASLPKVLGDIENKPLLTKKDLIEYGNNYGGVIIVGSHVQKTTMQLEALKKSEKNLDFIEFRVNRYFEENGLKLEVERIIKKVEKNILEGITSVVFTSRTLLNINTKDREDILKASVEVSNALTSVVGNLEVKPKFILAKGGITSSDVGTKALKVRKALVLGQVKKGIPVWFTGGESKFPRMPYIIFPGNVGEVKTLKEIVEELC